MFTCRDVVRKRWGGGGGGGRSLMLGDLGPPSPPARPRLSAQPHQHHATDSNQQDHKPSPYCKSCTLTHSYATGLFLRVDLCSLDQDLV